MIWLNWAQMALLLPTCMAWRFLKSSVMIRMYSGSLVPVLNWTRANLKTLALDNRSMQKSRRLSWTPFPLIRLRWASTGSSQNVRTYSLNSLQENAHSSREPPPSAAPFRTWKSSPRSLRALFEDMNWWSGSHSPGLMVLVWGKLKSSLGTLLASDSANLESSPYKIKNRPSVIALVTKIEQMWEKIGYWAIFNKLLRLLMLS